MKVLLAEDSMTMRKLLAAQVKRWKYDVTEVEDGKQAWEEFQRGSYQLVLTDWMMPEIDGLELIRRIRSFDSGSYVYIVLLTAQSASENLVEAIETGADDFLSKPCVPSELRVRLLAGERILQLEQTLLDQYQQLKLTQAALVQSEKLAGVGQLAAGMAHEINNPVAFVSNNLAVLQRDVSSLLELLDKYQLLAAEFGIADSEQLTQLKKLEAELDVQWLMEYLPELFEKSTEGLTRVREIVKNLRDFAHLDEAEIDNMNVVEALEATIQILGSDLRKKHLNVTTDFPNRPHIQCEPAKIKQVFYSILRNAIQASYDAGEIKVEAAENSENVIVEITDHGCGMDQVTRRRLFEPFFTTRSVGAGQGLGLSVAYGVIRQHGGKIEFETEHGKGSTFRLTLPKLRRNVI